MSEIDKNEVKNILVKASKDFNADVKDDDDDLDDLINQIIMMEKAHKHTSQGGTIRKHEQITSKINQFLNSES